MEKQIKKQLIQINELNKAVTNYSKDSSKCKTSTYFRNRIERTKGLWSRCELAHKAILENVTVENPSKAETDYFENDVFTEAEEVYVHFLTELEENLKKYTDKEIAAGNSSNEVVKSQDNNTSLKLPSITLPTFSGDYSTWTSFHDLFTAIIHNKVKLSNAEKLHYLKTSLTGEAAKLIQGISTTDANYDTAWKILNDRYQNTRRLVNSQLEILLSSTPCSESSESIKRLLDNSVESIQALKNLKLTNLWDATLVYMLTKRLPRETLILWEQHIANCSDLPSFEVLKSFLETRFRTMEAIEITKCKTPKLMNPSKSLPSRHQTFLTEQVHRCSICGENHTPKNCQKFIDLNFADKNETIRRLGLCINCLNKGHRSTSCPSRFSCIRCGKRHHSLLHIYNRTPDNVSLNMKAREFTPSKSNENKSNSTGVEGSAIQSMHTSAHKEVLLATAQVMLEGPHGNRARLRALVDQGSQASFISEKAAQLLKVEKIEVHSTIFGIFQSNCGKADSVAVVKLIPPGAQRPIIFEAFVKPKLSYPLPSLPIDVTQWHYISTLKLADPSFNTPGKIDVILGAEVYAKIILGDVKQGPSDLPIAENTTIGWILWGGISPQVFTANVVHNESPIGEQLQQFWKLEEVPQRAIVSPEDEACEEHFRKTHNRLPDGTYCVRLPFINTDQKQALGSSRRSAISSLLHLEKRFLNDPTLKDDYSKVIEEYLDLNHMHLTQTNEQQHRHIRGNHQYFSCYYLPHHAVFKDSVTTKLRVVFDASRKTDSGKSLNGVLLTGPKIQNELLQVLLQWRKHRYCFISDIEKMYRQVKIHPEDSDFQRIVWRRDPNEAIQDYCLSTVTFGVTCAPYLAIRVLQQLAHDEQERFPLGAHAIKHELYVDDLLSGSDSIDRAIEKQQQIDKILLSGGFKLRKWLSNDQRILHHIPIEDRAVSKDVELNLNTGIKSLGLLWYPATDMFGYKVNINTDKGILTKRELLSEISKIYDPLGWITPIIISTKILMQSVWLHGTDWDEHPTPAIQTAWNEFKKEIPQIEKLRVLRWLHTDMMNARVELHAFSDASQKAYAAVIYLRIVNKNGNVYTRIIMSKSKVAPVKPTSIPRLELCGVVIAARLVKFVTEVLKFQAVETHLWTDSMVVLEWLNSHPSRWGTFIANRTSEVLEALGNAIRHHVPTTENPADLASRGCTPSDLLDNKLWWHGPAWLYMENASWPIQTTIPVTNLEERKKIQVNICIKNTYSIEILNKYSSYTKLLRVTAYVLRFLRRWKKREIQSNYLTCDELKDALKVWIKIIQNIEFNKEIRDLKSTQKIDSKSKLLNLNPFLDDDELLRVGGRLTNSSLPYNERHPLILPKSGHFITLLIGHFHAITLHGGCQSMITIIRKQFWLLNARNTIRSFIHKCMICFRQKAQTASQLMGDLPEVRVTPARPFSNTGVDYCGPIVLRSSTLRGAKQYKGYIAIFVCMAVKAVHIEPVSDMTSTAFLAALRRFVARRGLCKNIYSDCGSNFIGANIILKQIQKENEKALPTLTDLGITWHFIPPSSPHFGGLWESNVKGAKYHLRRILGNSVLTFEELCTALAQIEACMNSRPLCAQTYDPEDLTALTPGHFLTGDALLAPPQEEVLETPTKYLRRWQLLQQLVQQFWRRWSHEYLHQLQQRPKWKEKQLNLEKHTLVLVKDDRYPPNKWPLGRIIETHAGADGLIRVLTIRTKDNVIKRPITKVAPLPIQQ